MDVLFIALMFMLCALTVGLGRVCIVLLRDGP